MDFDHRAPADIHRAMEPPIDREDSWVAPHGGDPGESVAGQECHVPALAAGRTEANAQAEHEHGIGQGPNRDVEASAAGSQGIEEDPGDAASGSTGPKRSTCSTAFSGAASDGAEFAIDSATATGDAASAV